VRNDEIGGSRIRVLRNPDDGGGVEILGNLEDRVDGGGDREIEPWDEEWGEGDVGTSLKWMNWRIR